MSVFGPLLIIWMLLLAVVQVVMLWKYVQTLRTAQLPLRSDSEYPPALAVLCIRGLDPFLKECIHRLLDNDYPRLTIRIVVDSAEDPALPLVTSVLATRGDSRAELQILERRLPHCSGKVSGLLHATQTLPEGCELVTWIDGDSLLHRTAIKELADGLSDPSVGAVSGNRWYLPEKASPSGLVRMFWNGFAVPAMNMVGILWGGCMATRAADFQNPQMRELLSRSFIEDSTISSWVRSTGRRTRLVASAILLNRESISLRDYYRFATRQLFTVRIDNSRWNWLALHMLTLNLTMLLVLIPMAMPTLPWWGGITLTYLLVMSLATTAIPIGHRTVKRVLTARGEAFPRISAGQWMWFGLVLMVPNQLNLLSTMNTFFIRELTWRGITYRFGRDPKCTIVDVKPLAAQTNAVGQSVL
jgi:cellulose synthase/poly-beta-1,6-N-acetylglucosamine synthase-like glycosyltransferase